MPEEHQTSEKILNTAFSLFLQKGYDNTSVQAIIDEVGIAKGTFYHHFKGKEAMLAAMIERMSRRVVEEVAQVVDDPGISAVEKLLAASRRSVARKTGSFGPETLILVNQLRSKANRLLSESLQQILTQWIRPLYVRIVRQGMVEGTFRIRDPETATDLVLGVILSMESQVLDRFFEALEGDPAALDRLIGLCQAIEQAVERILGAPEGSLPLYTCTDIRGLMAR